jgi:hypothetical protein
VDDLQSWNGPDVNAVRFTRTDGNVVDVLWSDAPTQATLPTSSSQAQVITRDGVASNVAAQGGMLGLNVSESPIYVVHKPATSGTTSMILAVPGGGDTTGKFSPICMASAQTDNKNESGELYFSQTGHNLAGVFRTYWEAHGGVDVVGYPITEAFNGPLADGKVYSQQYFERARLEYHPENQPPEDVQLGLLGVWAAQGRNFVRIDQAQAPAGSLFFPQTGQSLLTFKDWWNAHGGLSTFGFPISPEVQETNAADGKSYTVQYFERNRLEYHPENAGTSGEVTLGLLGNEYVATQGCH